MTLDLDKSHRDTGDLREGWVGGQNEEKAGQRRDVKGRRKDSAEVRKAKKKRDIHISLKPRLFGKKKLKVQLFHFDRYLSVS